MKKYINNSKVIEILESNFDLSIIMPFYHKMDEFISVFPKNKYFFQRNGIEVIIIIDSPNDKDALIEYIIEYPFVNWKIICNNNEHEWRNPAKPLNVGIKNATKKYVMVCSPESEFYTDVIFKLRIMLEYYSKCFVLGHVGFVSYDDVANDLTGINTCPYGSIMVERKYLNEIHGYDETLLKWGGDDDNIRARLEMIGLKKYIVADAILLHRESVSSLNQRIVAFDNISSSEKRYIYYPKTPVSNNDEWGGDFDNIIYDWRDNYYSGIQLVQYLEQFLEYQHRVDSLEKTFPIILLVQTFNEKDNINHFLNHVSKDVDAIILLDDDSKDKTYEFANNEKIILKVKKQRQCFNDIENRNLLLSFVSFFKYKLALFMDADERFDERFANLHDYIDDNQANTYLFNYVQLWNDERFYNSEYPYTNQGIGFRHKMFRNVGFSQIKSNCGKLHFSQTPTKDNARVVPVLIKHYGNLTKKQRIEKKEFYKIEDTENSQKDYSHLLNEFPVLKRISDINIITS